MGQLLGPNMRSLSTTGWILHSWGPALKNRLVGVAAMYKGLLDREALRSEDVVKYFTNRLTPHFIKDLEVISSGDFFNLFVQGERKH